MILTKEQLKDVRLMSTFKPSTVHDLIDTIDALTQTIAELKTEIAELSYPNWKGTALLWQREVCNALGIQTSDRATVLSAIAELTAKLADLEGIDKVADHANGVIGLMQADIDELTAKLDAVRSVAEHLKKKAWDDGICRDCDLDEQADELLCILDAPTKPKEARNGEE